MKSNHSLRLLAITILITSISYIAIGQKAVLCGTDIMTQKLLAEHPELLEEYARNEAATQNYVKNLEAQKASKPTLFHKANASAIYIIPIVFHILEENGPENISDAQIMSEMKILNEDWGHTNPDTGYAVSAHYKSIEGNMQVQFRLAQIDPNGNCTNGIDRIYTNLTNQADDNSKLNQWNPTKYVNVWVCKSINSAAAAGGTILGYAYFPFEVNNDPAIDGVLIANYCIGDTGTALTPPADLGAAPKEFSRCLSHEIGHVMNLEHPFGLTNSPGITGPDIINAAIPCGNSGVTDIPDTKGYYSYCPTGTGNDLKPLSSINYADTIYAEICDTVSRDTISRNPLNIKYHIILENFQNFMDYSECSMMFTQGQQERVWAALNINEAGRNNLWDTANLIATGVYTPPVTACTPVANFYGNTCFVCEGSKVNFYDASTNATPTKWDWKFTGAAIDSSSVQNPVVTFTSPYSQTVSLTVSNRTGSSTDTQPGYIYVSPTWASYFGTYSEGFENSVEVNGDWLFYNKFNDGVSWQYTNMAAYSGTGSLMLNSFQHVEYNYEYNPPVVLVPAVGGYAVWCAITPSIDLGTATNMTFSFAYSCATEATSSADITDTLEVDYSLSCGATWNPIKYLTGSTLTNAGNFSNSYTPSSPSEWQNISFPVPTGANNKSNVRFRFKYISSPYSNNMYIDNVNLDGTLGVTSVSSENFHLLAYPNPSSNETTISYYLPACMSVQIGLYDVTGRQLKELAHDDEAAGQYSIYLYNDGLSNGIYFIKMNCGNAASVTQKLIVIK